MPEYPSNEFQLDFLKTIQRLFAEGQFTTTYKFAMLHSLADISVELEPSRVTNGIIQVEEIGVKFLRLYWNQAAPYKGKMLAQNRNKQKPAAILGDLDVLRHSYSTFARLERAEDWQRSKAKAARLVKKDVLRRLQTFARREDPFLYTIIDDSAIQMQHGILHCLRAFYPLLIHLIRSRWLEFVRRNNLEHFEQSADLEAFLFGTERNDLQKAVQPLREFQKDLCFYCGKGISGPSHVDHFIPWARYPHDLAFNLVLAHDSCNIQKSDSLASREHVDNWLSRNSFFNKEIVDNLGTIFPANLESSRSVALWSYELDSFNQSLLWRRGREYIDFDPTILSLLKVPQT